MRLFEIINTPLNSERSLSYDVKSNRLKWKRKSGLIQDRESGDLISIPAILPKLTLRMVNRMKHLRRRYLAQQEKLTKLRGLMYGGSTKAREQEIEQAQSDLSDLQSQIRQEIEAADLEQERKEYLQQIAMRYVKS